MTRFHQQLLLVAASLLTTAPAFAVGVIAPIPRLPEAELRPAAPPKTEPDPAKPDEMEDPAKVVERIQQTAEAVGDRLKDKDTGTDTRKQQEQLLKDIDSLLKPPPPMNGEGGGGGSDMNMNKSDMPPPMGGGGTGGGMGGMPPPMGGGGGRQRQPRGSKGEGKPDQQPMGAGGMNEPKPMGMGMGQGQPMPAQPMPMGSGQPAQPGGANPGNGGGQKSPQALPLDVPITKEVWGHLPDKMRQEVSQYYREQYLPRYNELLKQYYTALSEREKKK